MKKLLDLINDWLMRAGDNAVAKLSVSSSVSISTISNLLKGSHQPNRKTIYKLAMACGMSKSDASEFAFKKGNRRE
jgi:transcriptional regulator with XRE-family HTH domain